MVIDDTRDPGRFDAHFTALWDSGQSQRTMRIRLEEAGFENVASRRVLRVPLLAKSMIVTAMKPPA